MASGRFTSGERRGGLVLAILLLVIAVAIVAIKGRLGEAAATITVVNQPSSPSASRTDSISIKPKKTKRKTAAKKSVTKEQGRQRNHLNEQTNNDTTR